MLTLCVDCILGLSCVVACLSGFVFGMHLSWLSCLTCCHMPCLLACPHYILYACLSMPCMIDSLGCVPSIITCLHVHIACLVHMPRLHYIGMHASPLDQAMIEVEGSLVCLYALHYIWNQNGTLGPLGHHALKCAIGGPRTKNHVPLSHKHDKGCVGAHICLECIAMPCFALCCGQNRILQEDLAGRPSLVPTDQQLVADSLTSGR